MTIPSPCVRQCALDAARICRGCQRTLDEIVAWASASEHDKRMMLAAIRQRADAIHPPSSERSSPPQTR